MREIVEFDICICVFAEVAVLKFADNISLKVSLRQALAMIVLPPVGGAW
jgi:hypothetical protein